MRYFIELSYFGKNYHGWQIQPDANSVQAEINKALSIVLQTAVNVVGAGRTDTGVHASQMFAHFDVEKKIQENFIYKCNSVLPNDIVVNAFFLVKDDSHARFDAVSRSYEYKIWLGRNPFLLETAWQIHSLKPNVALMNKASDLLLQYSDFESFSKVKTDVYTFNCDVTNAQWVLEGNELTFYITANRFLRNMVRAIVGTLLDVGFGKISVEDFRKIIESKNRSNAGLSVPAKGLFLSKITYDFIP
ncbi:tRNA pseudouridine(38-40) synthase TruA [Tenacibaculum sp. UWU-22]|uniref:tRNA pseudouridine(38-40) synthase TruA n=1 Tax=Tenacibaculum sp. UWU-22 TaxID=3234187 RepID=UPI0034DACE62